MSQFTLWRTVSLDELLSQEDKYAETRYKQKTVLDAINV